MTPDLGQDAGQALEDAVTSAATMDPGSEPATVPVTPGPGAVGDALAAGLNAYDRVCRPRTQMIARRSRRIGWMGQLSAPPTAALRDLAVRIGRRHAFVRALAPVLDWTPPSPPDPR